MIIPGFGMVSHVISTFSGKPVFGYLGIVYAIASIGILGFIVWSQLLFMVALLSCERLVTNLAVCWYSLVLIGTFMCKNPVSFTQSAGNPATLRSLTSSSETTCETSFNFTAFNNHFTKHTNLPHANWLAWFVGFAEGDGAILTSGSRPRFVLTQKESIVLYMIRDTFGFGVVRYFKQGEYHRFIVGDNANVRVLAHLFNGNLVIPLPITQLQVWLNVRGGIELISTPIIPTLNDAWLSGFTDAEGCLNVT